MKKGKIISVIILAAIFAVVAALALTGTLEAIEPEIHKLLNPNAEINEFFHSFTILGHVILDVSIIAVLVFYWQPVLIRERLVFEVRWTSVEEVLRIVPPVTENFLQVKRYLW